MRAEHDRGRPGEKAASNVIAAGDDKNQSTPTVDVLADLVVRCMRCRHPLTARRSVRIGLGPECRKVVLDLILAVTVIGGGDQMSSDRLAAVTKLDALSSREVAWIETHTKPRLRRAQLREALMDGRVDADAFLANVAAVSALSVAEAQMDAALDQMEMLPVGRKAAWTRPRLALVGGGSS